MHANVCIIVCPKCIGVEYLILIYTHRPKLMKSMGESWQFMIIIHDEGDFPTLCVIATFIPVCSTFKVLWNFPYNIIYIVVYVFKCFLDIGVNFNIVLWALSKLGPRLRLRTLWEQRFAWGKTKASPILVMPITIDIIEMRTHMKQSWGGPIFGNAHK